MKVVLAYSGGLDTSVIAHWLSYEKGYEVVAYYADVGQGENRAEVEKRDKESGAESVVVEDRKSQLAEVGLKAIEALAVYENGYLLGTALARPVIAEGQVRVAVKEGAEALAHGATGKGNDHLRLELAYAVLGKEFKVIAPWKTKEFVELFKDRRGLEKYAEKHGIPVPAENRRFSIDENLLHTSFEGGYLEDPSNTSEEFLTPARAGELKMSIFFEEGKMKEVEMEGEVWKGEDMFQRLKEVGNLYKVGVKDIVENRFIGLKTRGIYQQAPLHIGHESFKYLLSLALPHELYTVKVKVGQKVGELIYRGAWHLPLTRALLAFTESLTKGITGEVKAVVYPHAFHVIGGSLEEGAKVGTFSMEGFDVTAVQSLVKLLLSQEGWNNALVV